MNPRRRGLRRAEAPPPRAASDQPYSLPSSPGLGRRKAVEQRGPLLLLLFFSPPSPQEARGPGRTTPPAAHPILLLGLAP